MPVVPGEGGLPKVVLSTGEASAELYLHGATLTSWKIGGEELIFVSPKAVFAPPKAIRGGVPVCFPQFAMLGPLQTQHGFARNMAWQVAEEGPASCRLVLESSEATLAQWPQPFRLEMSVSLHAGGALQQELTVVNTGERPMEFTAALHTYFTVSDVANASVVGLKGLQYVDNTSGSTSADTADAVAFPGEVDRTYIGAPAAIKLHDSGRNSVLLLHKRGFADAVVWNPAEAKAASMGDLGAEHWRGFVCVEAAQARSGAVTLAAGQAWSAGVEYEYDHLEES